MQLILESEIENLCQNECKCANKRESWFRKAEICQEEYWQGPSGARVRTIRFLSAKVAVKKRIHGSIVSSISRFGVSGKNSSSFCLSSYYALTILMLKY